MRDILAAGFSHILSSKTYGLLIILALFGIVIGMIAATFGEMLWRELLLFLFGDGALGATRGVTNDGIPKAIASWKAPNSQAANPPSAMQGVSTQGEPANYEVR